MLDRAMSEMGPTQLEYSSWLLHGETQTGDPLNPRKRLDRGPGGEKSLNEAADLIAEAKFPVISFVAAWWTADAVQECAALSGKHLEAHP